jgi:hypothetical protein
MWGAARSATVKINLFDLRVELRHFIEEMVSNTLEQRPDLEAGCPLSEEEYSRELEKVRRSHDRRVQAVRSGAITISRLDQDGYHENVEPEPFKPFTFEQYCRSQRCDWRSRRGSELEEIFKKAIGEHLSRSKHSRSDIAGFFADAISKSILDQVCPEDETEVSLSTEA